MLVWKRLSLLTAWVAQCFLRHLEAVSSKYHLCLSSFDWTTGFITRSFFFQFQYESLNFVLGDSKWYCDLSQYHLSHLTTHQQWCPFIYTFQLKAFQFCLACQGHQDHTTHLCFSDKMQLSKGRKWCAFRRLMDVFSQIWQCRVQSVTENP